MTRMEAVNWLINIMSDIGKSQHRELWHYEQALAEIRELLEDSHWIPCSERLPEKNCRCLVTNDAWGAFEVDWNTWFDGRWLHSNDKPIAWMPLPKPYGGEENG